MTQLRADDLFPEFFDALTEPVEIVNAAGEVLGRYVPDPEHVRRLYERLGPLVDMAEIEHTPSDDFEAWRQSQIIPRYNAAGVKKFAFLLPPGAPTTVENGTKPAVEGKANFPTGYFATREQALKWLES